MRKINLSFSKHEQKNSFVKLYAFILIPLLILFVFMLYGIFAYNSGYEDIIKKSYYSKLESLCIKNDNSVQSISESFRILNKYDLFSQYTTAPVSQHTAQENEELCGLLSQFTNNNVLIDSIFIYDNKSDIVYSNSGTYKAAYFFSSVYKYADYPKSYWEFFKRNEKNYAVLSPTLVKNNNTEKTILPMTLSEIDGLSLAKQVIINIDLDKIINISDNEKLTSGSLFLLVNKTNRYFYASEDTVNLHLDDDFFSKISNSATTNFDIEINGSKMLVLSYPNNKFFKNYAYTVLIPYSDINEITRKISSMIIALFILVTLITLFISYLLAKSIYNPIETLFTLSNRVEPSSAKKVNIFSKSINKLFSVNKKKSSHSPFSYEMEKILPLMQEKYLTDFLNSDEHYLENIFLDSNFGFEYNYFCAIMIRIKFSDVFYNQFNRMEYQKIKEGMKNIIYSCFSKLFHTYILILDNETFTVLLNFKNEDCADEIDEKIKEFQDCLSFDSDLAVTKTAKGGIYSSILGLKQSYTEAVNNINRLPDLIKTTPFTDTKNSVNLSKNDEDKIYNYLMLGRGMDALNYIDLIVKNMLSENIPEKTQIQFYIQVIIIIFRVMKSKKINYDPDGKGDMAILSELMTLSITEIHEFISNKIMEFQDNDKLTLSKVDTQSIIDYINEHYAENISLDSIASVYNTTPKYISKVFKERIGTNFIDYLANIRIEEAKKLLTETNKSLWDILIETGFNNRNTFIRTFKKITGLSPSDYRKNKKNL